MYYLTQKAVTKLNLLKLKTSLYHLALQVISVNVRKQALMNSTHQVPRRTVSGSKHLVKSYWNWEAQNDST